MEQSFQVDIILLLHIEDIIYPPIVERLVTLI